jgi:hypothetical protein
MPITITLDDQMVDQLASRAIMHNHLDDFLCLSCRIHRLIIDAERKLDSAPIDGSGAVDMVEATFGLCIPTDGECSRIEHAGHFCQVRINNNFTPDL